MRRIGADRVTVALDGLTALGQVDLEVAPGRITWLIGTNGAGKTTPANVLTGIGLRRQRRHLLAIGAEGGALAREARFVADGADRAETVEVQRADLPDDGGGVPGGGIHACKPAPPPCHPGHARL